MTHLETHETETSSFAGGVSDSSLETCIRLCWECRHACQTALYNHCLVTGGEHLETEHVRLMTDCIQICQTAADFMTRSSAQHMAVCRACAEICEACGRSCESIEDMSACAVACFRCADSCQMMAAYGSEGHKAA